MTYADMIEAAGKCVCGGTGKTSFRMPATTGGVIMPEQTIEQDCPFCKGKGTLIELKEPKGHVCEVKACSHTPLDCDNCPDHIWYPSFGDLVERVKSLDTRMEHRGIDCLYIYGVKLNDKDDGWTMHWFSHKDIRCALLMAIMYAEHGVKWGEEKGGFSG